MPAELPRHSRTDCSGTENWLLDHPLQRNFRLAPGMEMFYTAGKIHMWPVDRHDLAVSAKWDWKTERAEQVIIRLALECSSRLKRIPEPDQGITDNPATDGPLPWDEFDWSI